MMIKKKKRKKHYDKKWWACLVVSLIAITLRYEWCCALKHYTVMVLEIIYIYIYIFKMA